MIDVSTVPICLRIDKERGRVDGGGQADSVAGAVCGGGGGGGRGQSSYVRRHEEEPCPWPRGGPHATCSLSTLPACCRSAVWENIY